MIEGLVWLGTRIEYFTELRYVLSRCHELELDHAEPDFAVFKLLDGSKVEVFGPSDEDHLHFDSGPVGGFRVGDIEATRSHLEAAGAEFIGPVHHWEPTGEAWTHFRAPDGNVYELVGPV